MFSTDIKLNWSPIQHHAAASHNLFSSFEDQNTPLSSLYRVDMRLQLEHLLTIAVFPLLLCDYLVVCIPDRQRFLDTNQFRKLASVINDEKHKLESRHFLCEHAKNLQRHVFFICHINDIQCIDVHYSIAQYLEESERTKENSWSSYTSYERNHHMVPSKTTCSISNIEIAGLFYEVALFHILYGERRFVTGLSSDVSAKEIEQVNRLGIFYKEHHMMDKSIQVFDIAVKSFAPRDPGIHGNFANTLRAAGYMENALQYAEFALQLNPRSWKLRHNLALIRQSLHQRELATKEWTKALSLNNECIVCYSSLGHVHGYFGNVTAAEEFYFKALNIALFKRAANEDLLALQIQLATSVVPIFFQSKEHIEKTRQRFQLNMNNLLSSNYPGELRDPMESIGSGSLGYYIIYQGYPDDDILRRQHAKIYWKYAPMLMYTSPFLLHGSTLQSRSSVIKVGFHSAYFYHHSVGLLLQGIIANLDRKYFHVTVFFQSRNGVVNDNVAEFIRVNADKVVVLPNSVGLAQKQIAEEMIDILVFSEVSSSRKNTFSFGTT